MAKFEESVAIVYQASQEVALDNCRTRLRSLLEFALGQSRADEIEFTEEIGIGAAGYIDRFVRVSCEVSDSEMREHGWRQNAKGNWLKHGPSTTLIDFRDND